MLKCWVSVDSVPRTKQSKVSLWGWRWVSCLWGGGGFREEANADARREWPAPLGHCRGRHDSEKGRSTLWRNNFPADPIKYRYLGGRKCYPHILLHGERSKQTVLSLCCLQGRVPNVSLAGSRLEYFDPDWQFWWSSKIIMISPYPLGTCRSNLN